MKRQVVAVSIALAPALWVPTGEFNMVRTNNTRRDNGERGAALVTVMLISALLLTACIAMLTAVGANSRNTTDVLAETKAYYAAESGLQASINVLRNDPDAVDYKYAVANPTLASDLSYTTVNGVSQVLVGSEGGYAIQITDPDNSKASTRFLTTNISFEVVSGTYLSDGKLIVGPTPTSTPPPNRVEISFQPVPETSVAFIPYTTNPKLGTFKIERFGTGASLATSSLPIDFAIDFEALVPQVATRTIRGRIVAPFTNTSLTSATIAFEPHRYTLGGSWIELCETTTTPDPTSPDNKCPNFTLAFSTTSSQTRDLYAHLTEFEPYRLKILAAGYGPNGSRKQLEGIVRKNFLNGLSSSSGLSMIGPGAQLEFSPGAGSPTYCGADPGIEPGESIPRNLDCTVDPNSPTGPAIGVSDQAGLDAVLDAANDTEIIPAPAIITDSPTWQQSPTELNKFLSELRTSAQHSGRYVAAAQTGTSFQNANAAAPYVNAPENLSGNGLTFVEGDLSVGPISGGGILVVTGNFTYNGGFNFRGLIIVAGLPGTYVTRSGAGNGVILGNLVIAPYDPNNLGAGFGSPKFATNGGGSSDLMFSGYSLNFDGNSSVSDFMAGVAEK